MSSQEEEGISWREEFNVRNSLKRVRRAVRAKRRKLGLVKEYREEDYPDTRELPLPPGWSQAPVLTTALTLLELHPICSKRPRSTHVCSCPWGCCCFCCKKPLSEQALVSPAVRHPGSGLLGLGMERGSFLFSFVFQTPTKVSHWQNLTRSGWQGSLEEQFVGF